MSNNHTSNNLSRMQNQRPLPDNVQQPHVRQPSTYAKSEAATWQRPTTTRPTTFHICKTRGCLCSFRLLMMGGVSPKTCWVSFKIRNNKNFDTLLHLVRFFTARQISIQIYHYFLPELIIFVPDVIGTNPLLAIALRYNASQHTENLRHKNILFLN